MITKAVEEKTKTYDPSLDQEEGKEFDTDEKVGFFEVSFRYASGSDKLIFFGALISSSLFGASMPGFCILFGDMIDGIGGVNSFDMLGDSALYMVYVGIGVYVVSFL